MSEVKFAGLYDLFFSLFLIPIQKNILKIAKKYKCKKIVDLGCGTGSQCILLHKNKFDVVGVDISDKMLAVAKRKSPHEIKYIHANIIDTKFSDSQFDCSIVSFVIHPNNVEKEIKILLEAKRITKDAIIITDYSTPSTFKGRIACAFIKIIENLATKEHKKNYYSYMKKGAINAIVGNELIKERYKFYGRAIETIVISTKLKNFL